jgi:hypothetical protein
VADLLLCPLTTGLLLFRKKKVPNIFPDILLTPIVVHDYDEFFDFAPPGSQNSSVTTASPLHAPPLVDDEEDIWGFTVTPKKEEGLAEEAKGEEEGESEDNGDKKEEEVQEVKTETKEKDAEVAESKAEEEVQDVQEVQEVQEDSPGQTV